MKKTIETAEAILDTIFKKQLYGKSPCAKWKAKFAVAKASFARQKAKFALNSHSINP